LLVARRCERVSWILSRGRIKTEEEGVVPGVGPEQWGLIGEGSQGRLDGIAPGFELEIVEISQLEMHLFPTSEIDNLLSVCQMSRWELQMASDKIELLDELDAGRGRWQIEGGSVNRAGIGGP
jgi:hypothetical protein